MNRDPIRYSQWLMIGIILLTGLVMTFLGEKIQAGDGFGYDGVRYASMVRHFPEQVLAGKLDSYYIQRIVPSALVYYGLRVFNLPPDGANIIGGFEILNLMLVLLSCYLWKLISDCANFSLRGRWLGFIGLFINFALLKNGYYYPVLTDTTAFALGMAMLYFYLKENPWGLMIITLIGAFTWPSIVYGGFLLLLFPRHPIMRPRSRGLDAGTVGAIAISGLLLVAIIALYFLKHVTEFGWGTAPPMNSVVYLSMVLSVGYLFAASWILLRGVDMETIWSSVKKIGVQHILPALFLIATSKILIYLLSDTGRKTYGIVRLFKGIVLVSIAKPLVFLVAHVVYFGPIVLLLVLLWRPVTTAIRRRGLGMVAFVMLHLFLSLISETRLLINVLPFFVFFLVETTERMKLRSRFYWVVGVLAVVFSKIWFPINAGSLDGDPFAFPAQNFFMNNGPWMSDVSYFVQGGVVVVSGVFLWWLVRHSRAAVVETTLEPVEIGDVVGQTRVA